MKKLMCVVVALLATGCIFANECNNKYNFDDLLFAIDNQWEKYYDIILRYDETYKLSYSSVEEIAVKFSCCDEHIRRLDEFFQKQYDGRCMDNCGGLEETLALFNFER